MHIIMKPKNLKIPLFQNHQEAFFDQNQKILFIPEQKEKENFKEFEECIAGFQSVHIEYCSGNGQWIHEKALQSPDVLWIAVEKKVKRMQKIWSKKESSKLSNLLIICGEAFAFTLNYLRQESVDEVYINFPDPWPKRRHSKFRLIQMPFVQELARVLKQGGNVHFITDDSSYSSQTIATFLNEKIHFASALPAPFYHSEVHDYGSSYFMSLWKEKKRGFYFSKFQKKCKYKSYI